MGTGEERRGDYEWGCFRKRGEIAVLAKITGVMIVLLSVGGCASLKEDFTARYGLTNPEYPNVGQTVADESYLANPIGHPYVEEYDKKYHEEYVLRHNPPSPAEQQGRQEKAQ
ncbi:MAG: hypothetical protein HY801_13435 [Candidatus Lindowbacteria bacterium]|nr:hypothetical protein [Candidatus Lindowbacteria bacterium]